mgnify:CR=1 FL=1
MNKREDQRGPYALGKNLSRIAGLSKLDYYIATGAVVRKDFFQDFLENGDASEHCVTCRISLYFASRDSDGHHFYYRDSQGLQYTSALTCDECNKKIQAHLSGLFMKLKQEDLISRLADLFALNLDPFAPNYYSHFPKDAPDYLGDQCYVCRMPTRGGNYHEVNIPVDNQTDLLNGGTLKVCNECSHIAYETHGIAMGKLDLGRMKSNCSNCSQAYAITKGEYNYRKKNLKDHGIALNTYLCPSCAYDNSKTAKCPGDRFKYYTCDCKTTVDVDLSLPKHNDEDKVHIYEDGTACCWLCMYEGYVPVTTIDFQYNILRLYRGDKYRIILKAVGTKFEAHIVADGQYKPTVDDIDSLISKADGDLPF